MVGKICPLVETELIFMTKTDIPHGPHSPTTLGLERATCFTINSTYVANVGCRISSYNEENIVHWKVQIRAFAV